VTAPVNVAQGLEVKFGSYVDKKLVETVRRSWLDGEGLAYGETGPVIGYLNDRASTFTRRVSWAPARDIHKEQGPLRSARDSHLEL
jgi:hypothetical protein